MEEKSTGQEGLARRNYIRYGGTALGAGMLVGCASDSSGSDEATTTTETMTETATKTSAGTGTQTTGADSSYSVTMEPTDEVAFNSVPESWTACDGGYADMAVALGVGDGLTGADDVDRYCAYVCDELPGVSVDREQIEAYPEVRTKKEFYELDSDVHLYDPNMLINWFDWDQADVDKVAENIAPFVGNLVFRRSDGWHDYRCYTLYEAFEKVAQVFQREDRYEAFETFHDEFIAEIQAKLPPADRHPNVFPTFEGATEPETLSPCHLNDKGTSKKQWGDLNVTDALSGTGIESLSTTNRGELNYEDLLEIDPDVVLVHGHERKTPEEFRDIVLAYMGDHPVGGELAAIQNNRVYRGGHLFQGPTHNLFLTERATKQLYPDVSDDVTDGTELFDRQCVVGIVNGEF